MRLSTVVGVCGLAITLTASACGGGGGSNNGNPNNPTPPSGAVSISIVGERGAQSFTPNPATVRQGDMLVWRNTDGVVHRIMLNDGSLDTGNISPGASSAELRLPTDGARYHCTIHPSMVGSINASGGEPPACTGPYC
jgi:plastocyanin